MEAGTPIGEEARRYIERGELVPDDITIGMFMNELAKPGRARAARSSTASRARWPRPGRSTSRSRRRGSGCDA